MQERAQDGGMSPELRQQAAAEIAMLPMEERQALLRVLEECQGEAVGAESFLITLFIRLGYSSADAVKAMRQIIATEDTPYLKPL